MLEHTRAQTNEELMETLREHEQQDSARFDLQRTLGEKQYQDPGDVFLAARDRRQEIKEQIRNLQGALRGHSNRRKKRGR